MAFESRYEQIITGFESKRREMLNMLINAVPTASEMHRRSWKVQQLDNAVFDIKTTLAACNSQIDKERAALDKLSGENERLQAQERKLIEDIKLLEGVTGMQAIIPCDAQTGLMGEINEMADDFRKSFAHFYFSMPPIRQEIPPDPSLEKDGHILVSTLRDYITLQFDHRSVEATLSKLIEELTTESENIEKSLTDNMLKTEREIENQRKIIEDEAGKTKTELQAQTKDLRTQGKNITNDLKNIQEDLQNRVRALEGKKRRLSMRCTNLASQNVAVKENFRRRSKEIDTELDRLKNRIEVLKAKPLIADKRLHNIALILNDRSNKIDKAIDEIRAEISKFNKWIRG